MESFPIQIPNRSLMLQDVPETTAEWSVIGRFALTFDPPLREPLIRKREDLQKPGPGSSLSDLRRYLFLEQRRWNHFGREPDPRSMQEIRELIYLIRTLLMVRDMRLSDKK